MKPSALKKVTIVSSKHNTTPVLKAIYEAADWMNDLDMLVPVKLFIDGRLSRCSGLYRPRERLVKIAQHAITIGEGFGYLQGVVVHELVHARQHAHGELQGVKILSGRKSAKDFDAYLLSDVEKEAYWYMNEYMKEVHGHETQYAEHYKRLGVAEFL